MIDIEALLVVQALTEKVEKLEAANDKLLRERNAIRRRAAQVRGGLKPYARPTEIVNYLMGEENPR